MIFNLWQIDDTAEAGDKVEKGLAWHKIVHHDAFVDFKAFLDFTIPKA